jgi:nucleoside-diphosphate-sugar epimerase
MIVGNGMIANSFIDNRFNDLNYIIFASGVSKSNEKNKFSYDREKKLLSNFIKYDKKLVYFSTTLVNSNKNSEYVTHKLEVESFIEQNFSNYLILRIPNVIGHNNKNQLFGFLYDSLINQKPITLFKNEYKWLMDVDDLYKVVNLLENFNKKKINIFFNNKILVENLLLLIEDSVQKKFKIKDIIHSDFINYSDNSEFLSIVGEKDSLFNIDVKKILEKYIPKILD